MTEPDQPLNTERSPRRAMCAAILCLEAIAVGLATPVMITVAQVSVGWSVAVCLGLALSCLVLAGLLRSEPAYWAGWALQLGAIGLGFVVPAMFVIGAIFALLWATADLLGRRIDRDRAAAFTAYRAEHG